jgi:Putative MetA-pathway of phenol degradation
MVSSKIWWVLAWAGAALAPCPGTAQIATDRPDFVESSVVVRRGTFQVETSVAYDRAGAGDHRVASVTTPTLLRLGVGGGLELRVESDLFVGDRSSAGLGDGSGVADASVGVKWHAADPRGPRPSMGVLLHAELPTGTPALRGEGVRPSLRGSAEWALPGGVGLGMMPGVAVGRDGGRSWAEGIFALVVGCDVSFRWHAFVESSFERLARSEDGGTSASFDLGVARLLGEDTQVDAAAFFGITDAAPDLAVTVGISRRFPSAG